MEERRNNNNNLLILLRKKKIDGGERINKLENGIYVFCYECMHVMMNMKKRMREGDEES
ncbi:hypothetical protein MTR_1g019320 [Medicago truncatula]|uniref:Uncharacterized protein n=1 Tax=Medicago truncatula TaxID=3880 RepID=G7I3J3_MEDTR|nr:hypothetical protein MTR_1g019320 [Medicago truncatula]